MTARSIMKSLALSSALFAVCSDGRAQGIACEYSLSHVIQAPDGPFAASPPFATAISPNGRWVVGYYLHDGAGAPQPFVFDTQSGQFTATGLPSWLLEASPADVNDHKIMVGTGNGPVAGQRGFVCDLNTGFWTELLPLNPPIGWSGATGISNSNTVCGFRSIGSKGDPVNPFQAFVFVQGMGFTDLGVMSGPNSSAMDISDTGTVVGWAGGNVGSFNARAFIHVDGQTRVLPPVPDGVASAAIAINHEGTVAIYGRMVMAPVGLPRGFAYRDGGFIDLGLLAGFDVAIVADIGAQDTIVGHMGSLGINGQTAFVWTRGMLRELDTLIPRTGNLQVTSASALSSSGTIVAVANQGNHVVSVVLAPVVVPGDVFPDCIVNINDLLTVIQWWGTGQTPGDANGDGTVNLTDLLIIIEHWST